MLSYYAVFDGHGGVEAAKYAAVQLHCLIGRRLQHQPAKEALREAFLETDRMFVDRSNREVLPGLSARASWGGHNRALNMQGSRSCRHRVGGMLGVSFLLSSE